VQRLPQHEPLDARSNHLAGKQLDMRGLRREQARARVLGRVLLGSKVNDRAHMTLQRCRVAR